MTKKYYSITGVEDTRYGVAYSPPDYSWEMIQEGKRHPKWARPVFEIRPFEENNGGFSDYQINNLGWKLCSEKLRSIIELNISKEESDSLEWLMAQVVHNGDARDYSILHTPEKPDVLDKEKTMFGYNNSVIKAVFRLSAIWNRHLFGHPGRIFGIIISEDVRKAVLAAKCTGIDFLKVPVSTD